MAVAIRKMKVEDLVNVRDLDLICWNDLVERCYGIKMKLAPRSDANLLSYLHSDPEGSFIAADPALGVVGSAFSHVWGATGWVGPLSILPSYQSKGAGKELLKHSLRYLEDQQCVDIGLETMPENSTNLGMYMKVGLRAEGLVIVLGRKLDNQALEEEPTGEIGVERFSESSVQDHFRTEVRRISGALRLGLDYTKEVDDTLEFSFGDTIIATSKDKVVGFSVVHTIPRRTDTPVAGIRVLAVDPNAKGDVLEPLLASSELLAADAGMAEVSISIPSTCRRALDSTFSRGYSVVQTFERMMWMGSSGMSDRFYNLCSWSG